MSRITRIAVAVSIVLSAVFSAVAAFAFGGHPSSGGASATTGTSASTSGDRVALPPKDDGGSLSAPAAPPISQPVPQLPPVTSGGS